MAPDINTLPPSRSGASSPTQLRDPFTRESHSPRTGSISLAAAATLNAADRTASQGQGSPIGSRDRRRSTIAMGLELNDPSMPSPGELASGDHRPSIANAFSAASPPAIGGTPSISTGDPHHHQRNPSLGEIHQGLEQEQEAQVNRLLQMIRIQQSQLQQLQRQHQHENRGSDQTPGSPLFNPASASAIEDSTPTEERPSFLPSTGSSMPPLPPATLSPRASHPRRTSQSQSPALRPIPRPASSISDFPSPSEAPGTQPGLARRTSRDESAFYQAETANLTRENQMLRHRIKELEKQLSEGGSSPSTSSNGRRGSLSAVAEDTSPAISSSLSREVSGE